MHLLTFSPVESILRPSTNPITFRRYNETICYVRVDAGNDRNDGVWAGQVGGIARQVAMGGANAGTRIVVNPFIWEDPTFMLINPAYQTMYKDYLWMNIGGGTLAGLSTADNGYGQQNAGLNFAIGNAVTVGAVFSYDPSAASVISTLTQGGAGFGFPTFRIDQRTTTPQVILPIANVWEALASFDAGALDLGFGFSYGTSDTSLVVGATNTSSTREASARMLGFRGGGLLDLGGGNALGFSAAFRMDKATDKIILTPAPTTAIDGEYSASGTELQVEARLKLKMSNRVNFIPYGTFATVSGEPKEDTRPTIVTTATPRSAKLTGTGIAVGAGAEYKTSDIFLAGGVSFTTIKIKVETNTAAVAPNPATSTTAEFTYTAIPVFNLGGEWWFLDWLAGRGGYFRALGSRKFKTSTTNGPSIETNRTFPTSFLVVGGLNPGSFDGVVTLGIGLRFGNFSLDATVSEEALRRGFGLIGAQDNINSFGFMNASYNFQ